MDSRGMMMMVVVGVSATLGCGGDEAPPGPTAVEEATPPEAPAPLVTLSPEETARIPGLTAQVRNGSFASAVRTKENARIFLSLVETANDPSVLAAALGALPRTWTHSARFTDRYELIGPEYGTIVGARLGHEDAVVQAAAIAAAVKSILGDTPSQAMIDRLVELATNHPTTAGRRAALEALASSSTIRNHPAQIAPYVSALDASEPWMVSGALFRLASFGSGWTDQGSLRTKLRALLTHADPGVRGRAALALAAVSGPRDAERGPIALAIMPLLGDDHPYTKSAAANALATLDHRPAIHRIVPLLDDGSENTYDISGYRELDGSTGRVHHDGSAWSRVDDAALYALQAFSHRVGERFQYRVRHQTLATDIASAVAAARTWYRAVQSQIPRP